MPNATVQDLDTTPNRSEPEPDTTEASVFASMRIKPASAEYSDCDGGCDDGSIDNY